jgi:hypothetical protein
MNHTNIAIAVAMLAATAVALIGAIGVNIGIQTAAAQNNVTDIENSETNFIFKQKLKNNCSGFSTCANAGSELFTAPPTPPT